MCGEHRPGLRHSDPAHWTGRTRQRAPSSWHALPCCTAQGSAGRSKPAPGHCYCAKQSAVNGVLRHSCGPSPMSCTSTEALAMLMPSPPPS
ncbi:hypothetical protein BC739_009252 [Kutzneria viridogrisea]|uniref:Uncharacterized protein n=1 Tax=Kutzneria viridogrisea TaxID=47990 RepID=A0ABR6BYK2_9PSEU|nr:hypothetical protein [Kutzneria viridogrisea]